MKKQGVEGNSACRDHIAPKWQNWDTNPGTLTPKLGLTQLKMKMKLTMWILKGGGKTEEKYLWLCKQHVQRSGGSKKQCNRDEGTVL